MLIVFRGTDEASLVKECPIIRLTHLGSEALPPRSRYLTIRWPREHEAAFSIYLEGRILNMLNTISHMKIHEAMEWLKNHYDSVFLAYGFPFHAEWEAIEKFPTLMLRRNHVRADAALSDYALVTGNSATAR